MFGDMAFPIFLISDLPVDVQWHLTTVLFSISLVTNGREYLFLFSLSITVFSLMCLLKSFAQFLHWIFFAGVGGILLLSCKSSLHLLDTSSLSLMCIANI